MESLSSLSKVASLGYPVSESTSGDTKDHPLKLFFPFLVLISPVSQNKCCVAKSAISSVSAISSILSLTPSNLKGFVA
jgi:hypothetical protein